jgi:hypothetical protein
MFFVYPWSLYFNYATNCINYKNYRVIVPTLKRGNSSVDAPASLINTNNSVLDKEKELLTQKMLVYAG